MTEKSTVENTTLEAYVLLNGENVCISFAIDDELSDEDLVGVVVKASNGLHLMLWAQVELTDKDVVLRQLYVERRDLNNWSIMGMRRAIAQAAREVFDVDRIRIEEARRTSGVRPGRIAGTLVFER